MLFATRVLVGIGEGGYGPAAPTILADLFPLETRGRILALFCAAIPVGSALGYVLGGAVLTHFHFVPEPERWRYAFYLAAIPGLLLGGYSLFQRDPRESAGVRPGRQRAQRADYRALARTRSYVLNCAAQTAMTFALGGIGFWVAAYLRFRGQPASATQIFGVIIAGTGLISTLAGGWLGDRLRARISGIVLSRLWLRDVTRVSAFHCDALYPVSASVVADGRLGLLYVSEYRSVEHSPGECCATEGPGNRLRAEHSRHSRTRGRASLSHHRLHCRAYELDDRVSLCLGNDARFRTPLVDRNEIPRGGYLAGRAGSARLMSSNEELSCIEAQRQECADETVAAANARSVRYARHGRNRVCNAASARACAADETSTAQSPRVCAGEHRWPPPWKARRRLR